MAKLARLLVLGNFGYTWRWIVGSGIVGKVTGKGHFTHVCGCRPLLMHREIMLWTACSVGLLNSDGTLGFRGGFGHRRSETALWASYVLCFKARDHCLFYASKFHCHDNCFVGEKGNDFGGVRIAGPAISLGIGIFREHNCCTKRCQLSPRGLPLEFVAAWREPPLASIP